jgi:hypothetical protein
VRVTYDNSLRQLRTRVLDESTSLAGLLRMCLMLGAETGSEELRAWASKELNGYDDDGELPEHRKVHAPLFIDSISGNSHVTGQQISPGQLPKFARDRIHNEILLFQPIEELERMAMSNKDSVSLTMPGFAELAALWSSELGMFQQILSVYYKVSTVTIAGVVGRVRTTLVELVSELVATVPADELPSQSQVDRAVHIHVQGKKNTVSLAQESASAVVGQDNNARQNSPTTMAAPPTEDDGWWTWPKRIGAAIAGAVAVIGSIVVIVNDWPF